MTQRLKAPASIVSMTITVRGPVRAVQRIRNAAIAASRPVRRKKSGAKRV